MVKNKHVLYQAPAMQVVWLGMECPIANSGGDIIEWGNQRRNDVIISSDEENVSERKSLWGDMN